VPGIGAVLANRMLAPELDEKIDEEDEHARREDEGADGRQRVQHVPAAFGGIGPDAARHAHQPGSVHREEGEVEADEHEPEHDASEALRQATAPEQRLIVVEGGKSGNTMPPTST
jgi:hypothetical protein